MWRRNQTVGGNINGPTNKLSESTYRYVQIRERTFEFVPEFTYLGSKVSNYNSMEAELRARMLTANRSFYNLKNRFTSKNLSRRTKQGLYTVNPLLFDTSPIWKTSLIWTFCTVPWFPVHFCSTNLENFWYLCSSYLCMVLPWLLNDVCSNWQSCSQFPIATVKAAY